jgi:hypothetical protein
VIAIIPLDLYAADFSICGTTDFRNASAATMPDWAFALHGVAPPLWHRSGTM